MSDSLTKIKEMFLKGGRKKAIENLVIFLVLIVIIISSIGYIFNDDTNSKKEEIVSINSNIYDPDVFENKLNSILSNIEGAGQVAVMVSYKTGIETIPLIDTKDNKTVTEDNTGGAVRRTQQDLVETSIIFNQENNGSKEPYISKTIMPQIEGVIVACEGGGLKTVRDNIVRAVKAVTGIESEKIQVFSKAVNNKMRWRYWLYYVRNEF